MKDYVWYLSYGSNLSKRRFLTYILGGKPEGSSKYEPGSKDKTLPLKEKNTIINYELYFSEHSKKWDNLGVGFIGTEKNPEFKTYAKMYLITKEQFEDIVKQENSINKEININYPEENQISLISEGWYSAILCTGIYDNHYIYTFTSPEKPQYYVKPSEKYLKTIATGIIENTGTNAENLTDYFINLKGIENNINYETIYNLIKSIRRNNI